MKSKVFTLLIWCIIFLFLNLILLVIYSQVLLTDTEFDTANVDVIFVARGRQRAALQTQLWQQKWSPLQRTRFITVHLNGIEDRTDTVDGLTHYYTSMDSEQDAFLQIASIIPAENRSPAFIWASDQVIPLQHTSLAVFERSQGSSRFFNALHADYRLLGMEHVLEPSFPCGLIHYDKMRFSTYEQFMISFISGRHKTFSFLAQVVCFPNRLNTIKRPRSSEVFQVAFIANGAANNVELNQTIKSIWSSYLSA